MKTRSIIILGSLIATSVGVAVFLGTRKAAASEAAARGFAIAKDCSRASVTNEDEAKSAVIDAALISLRSMDEPAADLLDRILGVMWPQCKITDEFTIDAPGIPPMKVGAIKLLLMGKTVGELKEAYESGKFDMVGTIVGTARRFASIADLFNRSIFSDATKESAP